MFSRKAKLMTRLSVLLLATALASPAAAQIATVGERPTVTVPPNVYIPSTNPSVSAPGPTDRDPSFDQTQPRAPSISIAPSPSASSISSERSTEERRVERTGRAKAPAGDILVIEGRAFKLASANAPSMDSVCLDMAGQSYRCGQQAATRLEKLIDGHKVSCEGVGNPEGIIEAACRIGREDIARIMVRDGWAQSTGGYQQEETEARFNRRGMWSGSAPVTR